MSTDELLAYAKQREKQSPNTDTKKIVSIVNSQSIEEKMDYFHIPIRCPDCEGTSKIKYTKTQKEQFVIDVKTVVKHSQH